METMEVYEETDVRMTEEVESCYTYMEVTSPRKRKKSKAQQREIMEKHKKPRSAYLLYYFDVHQTMQHEFPNMPQSEINKRISLSWKRLNVADKGYYLEKAKLEKEGSDKTSLGPSQDLSGFRRILPRADYVLLSKGATSEDGTASQLEVCMDSLESPLGEGVMPSPSVGSAHYPPLALGSEVELSEQCVTIEGLTEEEAVTLTHCGALHGALSPSYPSHNSHNATSAAQAGLRHGDTDPGIVSGGYSVVGVATDKGCVGGAVMQHVKTDLVTVIPSQDRMEYGALPGASSVGSIVMVPIGAIRERDIKPSYKLSMKYTRRGRGSCQTAGCSFVYVTRHKPPFCPVCGNHLGGKWVPTAKKSPVKCAGASSKASPQLPQSNPGNPPEPRVPPSDDQISPPSKRKVPGGRKTMTGSLRPKRPVQQCGVPGSASPEEGRAQTQAVVLSGTQTATMIALTGAAVTGARVKVQERNSVIGQKRPVRAILPAPFNTGRALVQWITVPPAKNEVEKINCSKTSTALHEKTPGLKPNTLKQLGQAVTTTLQQTPPTPVDNSQYIVTDKEGKILSVVPLKQKPTSTLDLGLSTARGRGRCKNPSCDYVYKNRHKPADCPCCGWELSRKTAKNLKAGLVTLLDPYQSLSPTQKELQRQSTLQLLRQTLQIPENQTELHDTLALIQELNSTQVVLATTQAGDQVSADGEEQGGLGEVQVQSGWPRFFESEDTHCALCHFPLFKGGQSSIAGQEDCWLLTDTLIQTASLQLKVCLNPQCLALHSFTHLHPGLFNVGNRLLVTLDLLFKIRSQLSLGQHPNQAVRTILDHLHNHPVHTLSPEEVSNVQELLVTGYWSFECLTVRDYNDMICGVCGIAPKVEIAQRDTHNVLELGNVQFTWPDCGAPDEVQVDDFWMTMESEAIEQAAFHCSVPITRVDASIIAPFIPPLMRSNVVINTEKDKASPHTQCTGNLSILVRLIHEGRLRPYQVDEYSAEELRAILDCCGETTAPDCSKDELLVSLITLYTHVQNGLSTAPQPPPYHTAGKLSKICPHQVVCGSKYLVRGETARDHVDLLVSSRYWPPVYVTDSARQVALCTDVQYPELAFSMWGCNQGCFSNPMDKAEFVSCAELQDQPYSADLSYVAENPQLHPVTKSSSRWIVNPAGPAEGQEPSGLDHHSMGLCKQLEPYCGLLQDLDKEEVAREEVAREDDGGIPGGDEVDAEATERSEVSEAEEGCPAGSVTSLRRRPLAFDNAAYYYLYNRLQDFLASREVVSQQIGAVLKACQPGEVVIRDALYRLGVAQINTQEEEDGVEQQEAGVVETDTGFDEEVVL